MVGRSKCSENSVVSSCPVLSHGRSKCPENRALLSSRLRVSCGHWKCPENGALPPAYRSLRFVLAGRREAQSGSTLAWFCVVIFSFFFFFFSHVFFVLFFRQCLSEIIDICMIVKSFRHCVFKPILMILAHYQHQEEISCFVLLVYLLMF